MATTEDDAMMRLQGLLDAFRADFYRVGRGEDYEQYMSRLKAEGSWPFPR